jgi:hypothetical protein
LLSTIRMEIHVKAQTNCVISSTSGGYYVYWQFGLTTLDKLWEIFITLFLSIIINH